MREEDFLEFVRKIYDSGFTTEKQQIAAILEFSRLVEHPSGYDLIYYPEEGKDGPENVVLEVKTGVPLMVNPVSKINKSYPLLVLPANRGPSLFSFPFLFPPQA